MSGNTFGRVFRVTTFGESHGRAVGCVVDGCPSGVSIAQEDIQRELDRRRPGQSSLVTQRKEEDKVEILSGIFQGKTTGTPIAMIIYNKDVKSEHYEAIKHIPRPGHADLTYYLKYRHRDYRGGGRSSGRETAARVAAGAIAKKLLSYLGVEVIGYTLSIAGIVASDLSNLERAESSLVRCPDPEASKKMIEAIERARAEGDSVGGVVEVVAKGVPPGLGEPVFDKLDAELAKAVMSVGAVKGVEIGSGFRCAQMRGSEHNDQFYFDGEVIKSHTNNAGGILGGISTGMPIVVRAAVKPTPSISKPQRSVNLLTKEEVEIRVEGRHDPCIVPRIVPVLEAMVAITLADFALRNGNIPRVME